MKLAYGNVTEYNGPRESQGFIFLGTDGNFHVEFQPGWLLKESDSTAGNWFVEGNLKILDEDHAGKIVPNCRVMIAGRDKNGEGMERGYLDIQVSLGDKTVEQAAEMVKKKESQDLDNDILAKLAGRKAYCTFKTGYTNGKPPQSRTELGGFITQANYEKKKKDNLIRWAPRAQSKQASANGAPQPYNAGGAPQAQGTDTTQTAF